MSPPNLIFKVPLVWNKPVKQKFTIQTISVFSTLLYVQVMFPPLHSNYKLQNFPRRVLCTITKNNGKTIWRWMWNEKQLQESAEEALNNLKVRDEESRIKLKTCF